MPRTFVIGDIHGAHEALLQVFERSAFDYEVDRLICLGDVCDRRVEVKACVDKLLKIEHMVMILGNHDHWALDWMVSRGDPSSWLYQGGLETIQSYGEGIPESHLKFFKKAKHYHIEEDRLFVHGGIDHTRGINDQDPDDFLWDRSLVYDALDASDPGQTFTKYKEVFVGHTPTLTITSSKATRSILMNSDTNVIDDETKIKPQPEAVKQPDFPVRLCNVWLLDTGAGWSGGRLSIMDIHSKETWQSDPLP